MAVKQSYGIQVDVSYKLTTNKAKQKDMPISWFTLYMLCCANVSIGFYRISILCNPVYGILFMLQHWWFIHQFHYKSLFKFVMMQLLHIIQDHVHCQQIIKLHVLSSTHCLFSLCLDNMEEWCFINWLKAADWANNSMSYLISLYSILFLSISLK